MRRTARLTLAVVLLATSALEIQPARACENATFLALDEGKRAAVAADKQLQLGNARKVVYALLETYSADEHVNHELRLLFSIAGLRSRLPRRVLGENPAKEIRLRYEADLTQPRLQALYAESLLRGTFLGTMNTPASRATRLADARALLLDLEARDLVPNAHAWAALARAHHLSGDATLAAAANDHCVAIAARAAVCTWALAK